CESHYVTPQISNISHPPFIVLHLTLLSFYITGPTATNFHASTSDLLLAAFTARPEQKLIHTPMSSSLAAAAGISHTPRHVVDCRSPLSTTSLLPPSPSLPFPRTFFTSQLNYSPRFYHSLKPLPSRPLLDRAGSRRSSDFNPKVDDSVLRDSRDWSRSIGRSAFVDDDDDYDDDDEEEEEEDRSLDLFLKFVQNIYRKISKRARKAVRSVLPAIIPSKLVGFSVDGVIVLAFLWVLKAFLETL
ncbi:Protein SHORT HYPOCOTYL IN WHITE LIGHT 1, partial [Linum grandiflorum]